MRMNGGLERSRQTRRKLLKHGADIRAARSEWRLPDLYEGDCGIDVIGPYLPVVLGCLLHCISPDRSLMLAAATSIRQGRLPAHRCCRPAGDRGRPAHPESAGVGPEPWAGSDGKDASAGCSKAGPSAVAWAGQRRISGPRSSRVGSVQQPEPPGRPCTVVSGPTFGRAYDGGC